MTDDPTAYEATSAIAATRSEWYISLALAIVTLAVFGQTFLNGHEYVNYDDHLYVTDNDMVLTGLNAQSVRWAMTAVVAANWHPLTVLSHMTDIELFGVEGAWGHHLVNVLWHVLNVVLLFGVLRRLTGSVWCSAFVAALFAWHPLRAESVAWVSERKDVLSGFFWMTTLWAYWYYLQSRSLTRYLLIVVSLALGLLAKPMLVTLPCVLLLLDYWPLCRLEWNGLRTSSTWRCVGWLALEKLPLLVLAAALSAVTVWAQGSQSAVASTELIPLDVRASNSVMSYNHYISKTLLPYPLYLPYPIEGRNFNLVHALLSAAGLMLVTVLAVRGMRDRPYLFVGWFWYLGTLVPVIGLIQVGGQAMADRYTYLPSIGLYIIAAWGLRELVVRNANLLRPVAAACSVLLVVLAAACAYQTSLWKNSITLFSHAVRHNPDDAMNYVRLATGYQTTGQTTKAIDLYEHALEMRPNIYLALYNLGEARLKRNDPQQNDLQRATEVLQQSLELGHNPAKPHAALALIYWLQDNFETAYDHARLSARANPSSPDIFRLLGQIAVQLNKHHEAILWYEQSRQLDPTDLRTLHNLAALYATTPIAEDRNLPLAIELATQANQHTQAATGTHSPLALLTLATAHAETGDFDTAAALASQALGLAEALSANGDERMRYLASAIARRLLSYQRGEKYHGSNETGGSIELFSPD